MLPKKYISGFVLRPIGHQTDLKHIDTCFSVIFIWQHPGYLPGSFTYNDKTSTNHIHFLFKTLVQRLVTILTIYTHSGTLFNLLVNSFQRNNSKLLKTNGRGDLAAL